MLKSLYDMDWCQIQLFHMRVMEFGANKTLIKVVIHMFLMLIIFLNQHYAYGGIRGCEIKDEIPTVVRRT